MHAYFRCTPILDARCGVRTRAHHCLIRLIGCGDKHPLPGCSPGRLADAWPGWKPLAGRGRLPHVKGQGGVAIFNETVKSSSLRLLALPFPVFPRSRRPLRTWCFDGSSMVFDVFVPGLCAFILRLFSGFSRLWPLLFGLHLRPLPSVFYDLLSDYDIHQRLSPPRGGSGFFTTNFSVPVPIALVQGHPRKAPPGLTPQGGFIPFPIRVSPPHPPPLFWPLCFPCHAVTLEEFI